MNRTGKREVLSETPAFHSFTVYSSSQPSTHLTIILIVNLSVPGMLLSGVGNSLVSKNKNNNFNKDDDDVSLPYGIDSLFWETDIK